MNIGSNATLNLHTFFWTNKIFLPCKWIVKVYSIFGYVGQTFFFFGILHIVFTFHADNFSAART